MKIIVNEIETIHFETGLKKKLIHGKISISSTEYEDKAFLSALHHIGNVDMREIEKFAASDKPVLIFNLDTKLFDWMEKNHYAKPDIIYIGERYSYRYSDFENDQYFNAIVPTTRDSFDKLYKEDEAFRWQLDNLVIKAADMPFRDFICL